MKIHFDNVDFMVRSGPNTFANRLAAQLTQDGHIVQRTSDGADVSLVFIQPSGAPLAKKVVQRLDGIWFKPELFWQNAPIQNLYRRAQGVIVQSQFDFKMIENWFGVRGNMFQIPNGISKTTIPTSRLQQIKQDIKNGADADYLFVSSANWHNQKR